ncbi:MAG: hypothetical protein SFY96_01215 [Planctomycetota bacterium]|nr:hypothetical protein [Planctomycetota bacterium]
MAAFTDVRSWVSAFSLPGSSTPRDGVRGACVTLRLAGLVVARESVTADSAAHALAARSALDAAKARLGDNPDDPITAIGPRLAISLELADALVPLALSTYAAADAQVRPGLEGVAARKGDRVLAMFPEELMLSGSTPSTALGVLAARIADDPTLAVTSDPRMQPPQLDRLHGITFARFHVTHLVQTAPDAPAQFVRRLNTDVGANEIGMSSIRSLGDATCEHLTKRLAAHDTPSLLLPAREAGTSSDSAASLAEQSIAAMALCRWARAGDAERQHAVLARVDAWWNHIAGSLGPDSTLQPFDAATATIAALDLADLASRTGDAKAATTFNTTAAALVPRILAATDRADRGQFVADTPVHHRALIAYALARLLHANIAAIQPAEQLSRDSVASLHRSIYRDTPGGELVAHMPWLGWTELLLADKDQSIAAAQALRDLRDRVRTHTLRAEDLDDADTDFAGGIVFTLGSVPLPTAQSFRAAAFVATMAGDPRLTTDSESPLALSLSLSHVRFVAQLAWDGPSLAFSRNPDRDRGGVRLAPWDPRLSIDAGSMALLTLCETRDSIERIGARATKRQEHQETPGAPAK